MIAPKLLSLEETKRRLEASGFKDSGERFSGETGNYSVWLTEWGEPVMIPEEGPDKMCAEWVLAERIEKVLETRRKRR